MIGGMRSFAKSPWALALFALIVVALVTTLGDPFQGVMGGGFVQVGDHQVRQRDVNRAVDQELNRVREETGEVLSTRDAAQRGITQQILSQQILRASMLAYADKIGVKASPSAVINLLNRVPGLKDAMGRLDMNLVAQAASRQNMTVADLEQDIRKDVTATYLQAAAFTGVVTPEILSRP